MSNKYDSSNAIVEYFEERVENGDMSEIIQYREEKKEKEKENENGNGNGDENENGNENENSGIPKSGNEPNLLFTLNPILAS